MRFAILVNSAPYGEQGAFGALQFCQAAIADGHSVSGIFFYQQGTLNANSFLSPASDEFNLWQAWVDMANENGLRLDVCISAALRRGVVDESESSRFNLEKPFHSSGLGQLAELIADSDRLVQF